MKTCIVYYSRSGNTRFVARELARKKEAELVPLEEEKVRRGLGGFLRSGFQAKARKSSVLTGAPWEKTKECGKLYLLTPIWAGNGTPAVNAFLDHADLTGKEVVIVTLQADPATGGSGAVHDWLADRVRECGGSVKEAVALHSAGPGKFAGEDKLRAEASKIG